MVEKVVRLVVDLTVEPEHAEAFKNVAKRMTEVTKAEAGTLGYEWFVLGDGLRFRLVETYADAKAVEAHFMGPAVQQWVPKLAAVCTVDRFEVYGDPGPKAGEIAAGLGAVVYQYWIGLGR